MGIYIDKNYGGIVSKNVYRSPIAGNVNAPLPSAFTSQRMVIEHGVMRLFHKEAEALVKLTANFERNLLVALLKVPLELYRHHALR
ncbi:MAG: hypothetical protein Q7K44_05450 [Candidatus Liptonbacteria bacterium]|nr:hypothetical protein [Candidatus Liptonbacteria bacterium]